MAHKPTPAVRRALDALAANGHRLFEADLRSALGMERRGFALLLDRLTKLSLIERTEYSYGRDSRREWRLTPEGERMRALAGIETGAAETENTGSVPKG